ncbi:Hypothetical predicted protein [Octopus vulgaris]|uniref:Uncharacterized protein n=1 Tax=Octopus vulgaris TaxID=6645 RepID=A0AA36BFS4_OCTVU|nr:Hypothetical predicted protein [Octopus vulgaris]
MNIQFHGFQQRYEEDKEFSISMRMIAALAFVPTCDVEKTFEILCEYSHQKHIPYKITLRIHTWDDHVEDFPMGQLTMLEFTENKSGTEVHAIP